MAGVAPCCGACYGGSRQAPEAGPNRRWKVTDDVLVALKSRLERLKQGEAVGGGMTYRETLQAWRNARRYRAYADYAETLALIDGEGRWDISVEKRWPW